MQPRSRKIAVFVGSAALATGVGVGVASQGDSTSSSQAAAPAGRHQPGGRPDRGMDLSSLAEQLGVSTDDLEAAMETARTTAQDPDDMAAAIAKELGLSEDEVVAALEAMRPDGAVAS